MPITEKQKMLDGELYVAFSEPLNSERKQAKALCFDLNQTSPNEREKRSEIVAKLLGSDDAFIESPFYCDYGYNIKLGKNFYANHGCTFLDCSEISIGDNVLFAPGVVISTASHPLDADTRNTGQELAAPIQIGNSVWIGANVTICPGLSIADNVVVGAGSVVTKDLPANCVCAGVPATVIRKL